MADTINFTQNLIRNMSDTRKAVRESKKPSRELTPEMKEELKAKLTEARKARLEKTNSEKTNQRISESKNVRKFRTIKEAEEIEAEEKIEEVPEEVEEPEVAPVEETVEGEDFEETIDDGVFFCATCQKHFIASPDTVEADIACPICGDKELIIKMGSAQEALEDAENEEVAIELEQKEETEDAIEELPEEPIAEEEFEFEEGDLEEALNIFAKRYISEKARCRIHKGAITKEGNLVFSGRMIPGRKTFTITLEGFKANADKKRFVCEGTTSLFKTNKVKAYIVNENNTYKMKKLGYGFITESAKAKGKKITGIIG